MTAAAWAVWVRRSTFRNPWERSTTYAIIQLALALVLIAPASVPILGWVDWAAWKLTGHWHLDDYVGNMLALGALVSSNLAGTLRMPSMRQRIVPLLWHPLVVGTAVLYFLFWRSVVTYNPGNDLFQLGHDGWLGTYFTLLWALLIYYGGLNAWVALAHLRGDPRAKPVALTCLGCVGLGGGLAGAAAGLDGLVRLGAAHHVPYRGRLRGRLGALLAAQARRVARTHQGHRRSSLSHPPRQCPRGQLAHT